MASATASSRGGGAERLAPSGVGPQLGDPPEQDPDADHAGQAARPHRELGAPDGRRHAGLQVAQAGPARHHGEEGARQATLEMVGNRPLLHVLAEHRRDHVGPAGHGQQGQAHPQDGDEPDDGDGPAPDHHTGGNGPTLVADAGRPPGEQRPHQGTGARRRVEQAHHARPSAVEVDGEGGEHGTGHPEDHGVEVDQVGGRQQALAPQVAEPLGHRMESHRGTAPARDEVGQQAHHGERHGEGGDVDQVDRREAEPGDQHPAEGGADHHRQGHGGGLEGHGRRDVARLHQHGEGGPAGGPVDALESGARRRADEEHPDPGPVERGVEGQSAHGQRHGRLGQGEDASAVPGVGQGAAPERPGEQGDQPDEAEEAHHEGGVGQMEGLVGERHQGELAAHRRDGLAGPETTEVARVPQRRDVGEEGGHPSTVAVGTRTASRAGVPVGSVRTPAPAEFTAAKHT